MLESITMWLISAKVFTFYLLNFLVENYNGKPYNLQRMIHTRVVCLCQAVERNIGFHVGWYLKYCVTVDL